MKPYKFRPFEIIKENYSTSFIPGERSGHRICCDDINLYSFGGYNFKENDESHNLYKEILCYNFITKSWKLINDDDISDDSMSDDDIPDELASSSMLIYGKTLVIFGGTSYPFGLRCSNTITLIKTDQPFQINELKTCNDEMNQPPGQYGMSIVCKDNYLYTLGGTQGFDYTADIYRLDFKTHKWDLLAVSRPEIDPIQPIGRYRHEIAIDSRYIYIFGGGTADQVFDLKELPVYDLLERKWNRIDTYPNSDDEYPKPRKCHSLVQHTLKDANGDEETFVYIVGGNNQSGPLSDVWRFSLKTRQWFCFKKAGLRTTLYFHDACITSDGCMYIFGGITSNTQRTNNLYKMWVTIPKLSSLAWDSILHYYPQIHRAPKKIILEKGIPLHFANRVHPN